MAARGRRPGLQFGYALAMVGAALVVTAAVAGSFPLMLVGMLLFGGGTAGNGQARYAAADLAEEHRRGRDLSIVVWATTIGSVLGPNLVGPGKDLARIIGIPDLAGSFIFSLAGFVLAFLVINRLLRPDPLLTSRALERGAAASSAQRRTEAAVPARADEVASELEPTDTVGAGSVDAEVLVDHDGSLTRGLQVLRAKADARLGMLTMALGHVVMVGVMVMTPIHMKHGWRSTGGEGAPSLRPAGGSSRSRPCSQHARCPGGQGCCSSRSSCWAWDGRARWCPGRRC